MIEQCGSNAHVITHRGRSYTIIRRSRDRGFDMFIDGGQPRHMYSTHQMMEQYPHLRDDLVTIGV